MAHFDRVDTGKGYTKLKLLEWVTTRLFAISMGRFKCYFLQLCEATVFYVWGRCGGGDGLDGGELAITDSYVCLCCTLVRRQRTRGRSYRWMLCCHFVKLGACKTPAINAEKYFLSACCFDGSAVVCPIGAPARPSWVQSEPEAVPVASMEDEFEP